MKVYDGVLGPKSLGLLQTEVVYNNLFPWNFIVTTEKKNSYSIFDYSFAHIALHDEKPISPMFNVVNPILTGVFEKLGIEFKKFLRFRFALQTPIDREYLNEIHIDSNKPHKSAIFYLNNSDGNTILYSNRYDPDSFISGADYKKRIGTDNFVILQEVEPIENRLLVFDGFHYHRSQRPTNHPSRIILNINFV